jgi:succinyl-CoA synthetase beta subunit
MRLLEFEAKNLLAKNKIKIPPSTLVKASEKVDFEFPAVLKVQIPLGGRGKAGGVLEAESPQQAAELVERLTSQPIRGFTANSVLIEQKAVIEREFFMAVTYDTVAKLPLAIFTTEGGIDVEELAKSHPDKVIKRHFSARSGLMPHHAREMVSQAGISGKLLLGLGGVLSSLAGVFLKYDCTILEVNPLALTAGGELVALDCHADIEDDALFRHPELAALENDPTRFEAEKKQTEFERAAAEIDNVDHRGVAGRVIEFDGNIGLIIGGGGASLTAFDAVKQHGGKPANYCEIGGNPSVRKTQALTEHILSKPGVESVSVIMNVVSNTRVDLVARGIIKGVLAAGKDPAKAIAVFRVPGAWEEEGYKILEKYGVEYCGRTVSIDEAARIAVQRTAN